MAVLDNVAHVMKLLEAVSQAELKRELLSVVDEALGISIKNRELERENHDLKERLRFQGTLRFEKNVLWSDDPADRGPFCNACWQGNDRKINLQRRRDPTQYDCPKCKHLYHTDPKPFENHASMDLPGDQDPSKMEW